MSAKPIFDKEAFCEHCGDLEPYSMTFNDDGVWWCQWCVRTDPEEYGVENVNWEESQEQEKQHQAKYYESKVKSLSPKNFEFITCEAGDWEVLKLNGEIVAEGHSINRHQWVEILKDLGCNFEEREISDEDMEMGEY